MSIYDAAMKYQKRGTPLVVIAGQEYGTGSSRDWAAKGTNLLGVKAVVAQSFERIHRSNLVGMGVLPLQFKEGTTAQTPEARRHGDLRHRRPRREHQAAAGPDAAITRKDGAVENVPVRCRIDTPIEIDYYQHGGILPFVLRPDRAGGVRGKWPASSPCPTSLQQASPPPRAVVCLSNPMLPAGPDAWRAASLPIPSLLLRRCGRDGARPSRSIGDPDVGFGAGSRRYTRTD
jgi:hypothetical protein